MSLLSAWSISLDSTFKCEVHTNNPRRLLVGSLKMNTTLEYSTRLVQEGDRRCKKSTLNDLVYLTPLRIHLMNPVFHFISWRNLCWQCKFCADCRGKFQVTIHGSEVVLFLVTFLPSDLVVTLFIRMHKIINLYSVFLSLGVFKHYGTLYTLQVRKARNYMKDSTVFRHWGRGKESGRCYTEVTGLGA